MSVEDERLRSLLGAGPPVPVEGVFERVVRRKARRERGRKAATIVAIAGLLAVVGGTFLVAGRTGAQRPAASIRPSIPPSARWLPGVPFPICDATTLEGPLTGRETIQVAYLFGRATPAGCPGWLQGTAYLALERTTLAVASDITWAGPVPCDARCSLFGSTRVGDTPVLAVQVTTEHGARLDLYAVHRRGTPFTVLARVPWGTSGLGGDLHHFWWPCGPGSSELAVWSERFSSGGGLATGMLLQIRGRAVTTSPIHESLSHPSRHPDAVGAALCR